MPVEQFYDATHQGRILNNRAYAIAMGALAGLSDKLEEKDADGKTGYERLSDGALQKDLVNMVLGKMEEGSLQALKVGSLDPHDKGDAFLRRVHAYSFLGYDAAGFAKYISDNAGNLDLAQLMIETVFRSEPYQGARQRIETQIPLGMLTKADAADVVAHTHTGGKVDAERLNPTDMQALLIEFERNKVISPQYLENKPFAIKGTHGHGPAPGPDPHH